MSLEIVTDRENMRLTVGPKVFEEPHLWKIPEWSYDLKQEITPHPNVEELSQKDRNKFFCASLGPKFNSRFLGANYSLWLGDRFTTQTKNMLRNGGRSGWNVYSKALVMKANKAREYVLEAERDGLTHLIPAIVLFGLPPQKIRREVGGATWKRIAANSRTRNMLLMQRAQYLSGKEPAQDFVTLLDYPSGVLLGVHGIDLASNISAKIAPQKTRQGFEQTRHTVYDAIQMIGDGFNPSWSLKRIIEEHDKAVTVSRTKEYSDKAFDEHWSFEKDGFSATLLTSPLQIAVEGGTQHHCVASYWKMASDGEYAVLRIDGPERATLGARKHTGAWFPDQVYGACNAAVSKKCEQFAFEATIAFNKHKGPK